MQLAAFNQCQRVEAHERRQPVSTLFAFMRGLIQDGGFDLPPTTSCYLLGVTAYKYLESNANVGRMTGGWS